MEPAQLVDKTFGPHHLPVAEDRVADFVEVTGDQGDRWTEAAPPGFAAAALFAVAPDLLGELSDRSVIHGEQTFTWHRPMEVGGLLEVTGTVTRARERRGVHFVGFDVEASNEDGRVVEGSSLFVVSGEAIPGAADFERPEPPHAYRGEVEPGQVAASRAELIRYAAATRDWNPVHWDHDAAVAAGLPGVVVHGLLQSAWALAAVTSGVDGPSPLGSARVRFRNPLLPARPVGVTVDGEEPVYEVAIADETTTYLTARIEVSGE